MIEGSLVALITPFRDDELDEDAIRSMVDWHIEQGTHGIVPVGTTGESATLTEKEHCRVIELVVDEAAGRIPIVAGAGSNNTREAIFYNAGTGNLTNWSATSCGHQVANSQTNLPRNSAIPISCAPLRCVRQVRKIITPCSLSHS